MTHIRSRRCLIAVFVVAVLVAALSVTYPAQAEESDMKGKLRVYIGSYTRGQSEGIYVSELDLETGQLSEPRLAAKAVNPSNFGLRLSRDANPCVGHFNDGVVG